MNFLTVMFIKLKNNPFYFLEYLKKFYFYIKGADNKINFYKNLNNLNSNETLDYIMENNKSFVRFGDGEFDILNGGTIYQSSNTWGQTYDKKLQQRLLEIFTFKNNNFLIGINHSLLTMNKVNLKKNNFYFYFILYQSGLWKYLDKTKTYGDALIFRKDLTSLNLTKLLIFLKSKELLIVTSNINKFNGISFSKKVNFIETPKSNAYNKYDLILKKILMKLNQENYHTNKTLILISLGPTAKPLVLDLTKNGNMVWDMGHFFDFYLNDIKKSNNL